MNSELAYFIFDLSSSMRGACLFFISAVFIQIGWIWGLLFLVLIAFLSTIAINFLFELFLDNENEYNLSFSWFFSNLNYWLGKFIEFIEGKTMLFITFISIRYLSFILTYLICAKSIQDEFFNQARSVISICLVMLLAILSLINSKVMNRVLNFVELTSTILMIIGLIVLNVFQQSSNVTNLMKVDFGSLSYLTLIIPAFFCTPFIVKIFYQIKRKDVTKTKLVANSSIALSFAIYIIVGFLGMALVNANCNSGDLLSLLGDPSSQYRTLLDYNKLTFQTTLSIITACFGVLALFRHTILLFVGSIDIFREHVANLSVSCEEDEAEEKVLAHLFLCGLFIVLNAMNFTSIFFMYNLYAVFSANLCMFILLPCFYFLYPSKSKFSKILNSTLLIFGISFLILGICVLVKQPYVIGNVLPRYFSVLTTA